MDEPVGPMPDTDEMLTMRPRPCAFMTGATAFIRRIGPVRLMAMILSHSQIGERDSDVVGGVVDKDVETAKAPGHVADHPLHRRAVGDVAGEGGGIYLLSRGELAGDILGLVAALRIHD